MRDNPDSPAPVSALPPDDPRRDVSVVRPDDTGLRHVALVGGTYTILLDGAQTAGRFAVIDMHVLPRGGPPPHRHDFEEMFQVLEGEVELTFRGRVSAAPAGTIVNIPANAPHAFKNVSDAPARLLCTVSPAGEEDMFLAVGDPVAGRTAPPPPLTDAEKADRAERAKSLAATFKNEMVGP